MAGYHEGLLFNSALVRISLLKARRSVAVGRKAFFFKLREVPWATRADPQLGSEVGDFLTRADLF